MAGPWYHPASEASPVCPRTGRRLGLAPRPRRGVFWWRVAWPLGGLAALVWFLVRVVPRPSRAAYPCQRVAMPLASSFVLWVAGLASATVALRGARRLARGARWSLAALACGGGLLVLYGMLSLPVEPVPAAWDPDEAPNSPVGSGRGIHPGRVVWAHDPDATSWDGSSGYWWSDTNTAPERVEAMLSRSLRRLTEEATDAEAWAALFRHFNRERGRGDVGYREGEAIAIKINMNVASDYALTNEPIPSPQLVRALLGQLIEDAGVAGSAITVYDASRCINDAVFLPCHDAYPAVRFVDRDGQGERDAATPDETSGLDYGDTRVSDSGTSRVPACVAGADYLINVALLRGHTRAGVTLCAKNHFGSVWRPGGGFSPSNIHISVDIDENPAGAVNSLVDLMGHRDLGGKTLLFMIDGLYGAVHQGSSRPSRWRSSPFLDDWTSSLFLSQDGVAIDSVGLDFCRSEPNLSGTVAGGSVDNYLHEAALAGDPPSGVVYDPEGDGSPLTASLGVHEHWDDAESKRYSRNLGVMEGIELVRVGGYGGFRRGDANADGSLDLSDPVAILLHLFAGGVALSCASSADADDSGEIDVADAVHLLAFLFRGAAEPPPPLLECGVDPTPDDLGCEAYPPCGGASGTLDRIVTSQSAVRLLVPSDGAAGLDWTDVSFDDSTWDEGQAALGYDESDDYLAAILTDLDDRMRGVRTSVYIRVPFTTEASAEIERLTLWMQYDDGFVAYLNGQRVAGANAPADPRWDSSASDSHADGMALAFESFDLTPWVDRLNDGPNILAVHGLNVGLSSSDFLIGVELEARRP